MWNRNSQCHNFYMIFPIFFLFLVVLYVFDNTFTFIGRNTVENSWIQNQLILTYPQGGKDSNQRKNLRICCLVILAGKPKRTTLNSVASSYENGNWDLQESRLDIFLSSQIHLPSCCSFSKKHNFLNRYKHQNVIGHGVYNLSYMGATCGE